MPQKCKKMIIVARIAAGLAVVLLVLFFVSRPGREWFAFSFELGGPKDRNSVLNAARNLLDAPAGKHGFLKVSGNSFVFEDGTPARFWGTNLCLSANFPSKAEAKLLADHIAFLGFNAVRLHHMDFGFEPEGIFRDTCPSCRDPQKKRTGALSRRQLDRLNHLIYQLKKRGIYIDLNLLVSRRFTLSDGVKDADRLRRAAKPASLFDEKLITLQKEFARALLTHTNRYTRLRYNNDPAIALIEITNENTASILREIPLPGSYSEDLNKLRQGALKDTPAFYLYLEKNYIDDMVGFIKKDCGVSVPVTGIAGHTEPWTRQASENADFIDTHAYWDHPRFPRQRWDKFDFTIRNKPMLSSGGLGIIGQIRSRQPLDKPFTISEWNHCYPNEYAFETPLLVASESLRRGWDAVFQFALAHNLDIFKRNRGIQNTFDVIADPQGSALMLASSTLFLRSAGPVLSGARDGTLTVESSHVEGASGALKNKELCFPSFCFTSNKDGAIALFSAEDKPLGLSKRMLLLATAGVKNTGSGWDKKGRFRWGRAPVLLKKMDVSVSLDAGKKIKVYALDEKGRRKFRVKVRRKGKKYVFTTKNTRALLFEIERP